MVSFITVEKCIANLKIFVNNFYYFYLFRDHEFADRMFSERDKNSPPLPECFQNKFLKDVTTVIDTFSIKVCVFYSLFS
jgi:hypothetical protein